MNGTAIVSLPWTNSFYNNDNVLFLAPLTPYFDLGGVSFLLTGGDTVNMGHGSGIYTMHDPTSTIYSYNGSFTLTPISAPVPEPGTILLLGLGLLMLFNARTGRTRPHLKNREKLATIADKKKRKRML